MKGRATSCAPVNRPIPSVATTSGHQRLGEAFDSVPLPLILPHVSRPEQDDARPLEWDEPTPIITPKSGRIDWIASSVSTAQALGGIK
jgi:hypothetical protein